MPSDDMIAPTVASSTDFDTQVTNIAALGDPLRRRLYQFVIAQPTPVNRDQVVDGTGVARHVAKFHLDKLVDEGLLTVEFARPPGRRGPGAGRPAKIYQRSSRELAVSLPQREYELAGHLLAKAVTSAAREAIPVGDALGRAAHDSGRGLGRHARQQAGKDPKRSTLLTAAMAVLGETGYEPRADRTSIILVNCPFHGLARDYTELVCGMNLDLMTGFVEGLAEPALDAHLEPAPGLCCVRLRLANADTEPPVQFGSETQTQ